VSRLIVANLKVGLFSFLILGMVGGVFGGGIGGTFQSGMALVSIGAPSLIGAFLGALIAIFGVLALGRQRRHV
jgi:uncharacterized membrane protein YeaQ/YmgE (transglycosylase-associated protein family)